MPEGSGCTFGIENVYEKNHNALEKRGKTCLTFLKAPTGTYKEGIHFYVSALENLNTFLILYNLGFISSTQNHCLIGFYCLAHCPYYIHREFFTNNIFKAWWHFHLLWISLSAFLHSLIHISLPMDKMALFKALWAWIYIYYATTESHACQ